VSSNLIPSANSPHVIKLPETVAFAYRMVHP
jgi:hypothetical protein